MIQINNRNNYQFHTLSSKIYIINGIGEGALFEKATRCGFIAKTGEGNL